MIGALELGGSHISAARVMDGAIQPGSMNRRPLRAGAPRDELLSAIVQAARDVSAPEIAAWGVATPGPFDYERGIVTIRGVGKLDSLHGLDLRAALADALDFDSPERIRFLNDADAFLLGEWVAGLAKGHRAAVGITLGTGLGSAFLREGRIMEEGSGVPREGRLDLIPFRGRPVEETISAHGLAGQLRDAGTTDDLPRAAVMAREDDPVAGAAFAAFGTALGEFLDPWLEAFRPSCLVVGGSIARAWDLIEPAFHHAAPAAATLPACGVARHLDEAALIGAADYALES